MECKVTVFPLTINTYLGEELLDYRNTLLFLKLSTTNFSSNGWIIFPTGIVTVEF